MVTVLVANREFLGVENSAGALFLVVLRAARLCLRQANQGRYLPDRHEADILHSLQYVETIISPSKKKRRRLRLILMLFTASTILVDLFFCSFPWLIVMPLQRPKREKYLIAGSMSLGVV